jgi:hypothetical protein
MKVIELAKTVIQHAILVLAINKLNVRLALNLFIFLIIHAK